MFRISVLLAVACGAGCVAGDVDEQVEDVQQPLISGCEEWMCGTNGAQIAEFGFWDLNMPVSLAAPGMPNNVGFQLRHFAKGTGLYLPRVVEGRLVALPTTSLPPNNVTLTGSSLVHGILVLNNAGRTFHVRVTETGEVASWAKLAGPGQVYLESYKLEWSDITTAFKRFTNVCTHPGGRDDTGMNGPLAFHTLLFEGDRISAEKKQVHSVDSTWFNLGCAGSPLAKMALTGHTEASKAASTFVTTLPERQAMLKMLAADYCGDGTPFTVSGQPLNWADDHGTMKLSALIANPVRPLVREARWSADGAACLDKPRLDVSWSQLGEDAFGTDVYSQVQRHCPRRMPPPCTDSTFDLAGYHLVTGTEPSPPPP